MEQMKILMVSPEYAGVAMTGGLGTAVTGLARALQRAGNEVRVIVPFYEKGPDTEKNFSKFFNPDSRDKEELKTFINDDGVRVYLAQTPSSLMSSTYRNGPRISTAAYWLEDTNAFEDSRAFSLTVPSLLENVIRDEGWIPDVVHLHEWQVASTSQAIKQRNTPKFPILVTTHNARYSGHVPQFHREHLNHYHQHILDSPLYRGHTMTLETDGDIFTSLLEMGIKFADAVSTVSPSYAQEILDGADHADTRVAARMKEKGLVGILNGIDLSEFNPRKNEHIYTFDPGDLESVAYGKGSNKLRLHQHFGIEPKSDAMQISFMSRLVEQKGIDVLMDTISMLNKIEGIQLLIVGETYDGNLRRSIELLDGNSKGRPYFAAEAEQHLILAGSDATILPSRYEPCGLVPLEGMAMGAVPIVTRVGGLKDTMEEFDGTSGYGVIIKEVSQQGIIDAVRKAKKLYDNKVAWKRVVSNSLGANFSWDGPRNSVAEYEKLYAKMISQKSQS